MKSLKNILCVAIFSFAVAIVSADDWYVCLGSFKLADNARQFSSVLTKRLLPNTVTVHDTANGTLYRVVYDRPFENRDEARIFRTGLLGDRRIQALGIKGLWICETKIGKKVEPQGEVLQKNDVEMLPFSEENPYSLKVRSYKEEHPAQQSSERLRANNIDAYVVKTYDDDAYFSFDVYAGAFATPEESAETADALAALGIDNVELSDYADIKEKMLRYDEVVQQDNVVFETAENAVMPEFSEAVRTCLAELPVNKNFLIESITIVDFETLPMADGENFDQFRPLATETGVRAISKAVYFDDLFGKRVEVTVTERAGLLPEEDTPTGEAVQFALPGGDVLHARVSSDGAVRTLKGMNTARTLAVRIDAQDFSDDEFSAFMDNAWSDSATVVYPQLRKSLCVLPKHTDNRPFVAFTLSRVDESYAESKGYANWAIPIVGHWKASGYFLQDDEEVSVSFFDMDYAHNAQRIHEMFMDEKRDLIVTDSNHSATVHETDAWYVEVFVKEISFSIKSFIVAVDTDYNSSINEDELNMFAADLLIWAQ